MSLSTGTRLGPYEILAPLGAGGMGEVYRARDTRLNREVAIKALPEAFAQDPERLARFQREAQVLAALNHPNIAGIHGLEEHQGAHYLAMEYVAGDSPRGPMPVDEALHLARQLADALEAAHEKGIVHRDLKPDNLKVTPDGKLKVLDFGLAKTVEASTPEGLSHSPTLSLAGTRAGLILGTAAYMSPEQARGKPVDRRTDIWAFGCVLYEWLTGLKAFTGETVTDYAVAIMTKDPDWTLLPQQTPRPMRDLLRHCLQKDPHLRLQHIGDARWALDRQQESEALTQGLAAQPAKARPAAPWLLAGLLPGLLLALWIWSRRPPAAPLAARFALTFSDNERLLTYYPSLAISPDGTKVAYVSVKGGSQQLFVRSLDRFDAAPIPATEAGNAPAFSPDGKWLAFFSSGQLKKVALGGGAPVTICAADDNRGAAWLDDQTIVFTPNASAGLWRVSAAGGAPTPLTMMDTAKQETSHRWPSVLPRGKGILFTVKPATMKNYAEAHIAALNLKDGKYHTVVEGATDGRYAGGQIVFIRDGELLSVPFDIEKLETTGTPTVVEKGISQDSGTGAGFFSISSNGTLAFAAGGLMAQDRTLHLVDRTGKAQPVSAPPRAYASPRFSPDGRRIAVTISAPYDDLWIYDLDRGGLNRFTFTNQGGYYAPIWSPDGKWIVAGLGLNPQNHVIRKPVGGGQEEVLHTSVEGEYPTSWSPDGRLVAFRRLEPKSSDDLWMLSLPAGGKSEAKPFLATSFSEAGAAFSPDGKWLAYSSNESGHNEIYVRAFPQGQEQWSVSIEGGTEPQWARSGRELFYLAGNKMMAVDVDTRSGFRPGKPRVLFEGDYAQDPGLSNYSVAPGDKQFLLMKSTQARIGEIRMVLNWTEALKRSASR